MERARTCVRRDDCHLWIGVLPTDRNPGNDLRRTPTRFPSCTRSPTPELESSGTSQALFAAQSQNQGGRVIYPPAAYATLFALLTVLALASSLITFFKIPETHGRAVTLQDIERDWN